MASKDTDGRRPSGSTGRNRNAFCSFCRKSYRDVGPLVEGPGDVYICGECIELCQSIIDQEKRRRGGSEPPGPKPEAEPSGYREQTPLKRAGAMTARLRSLRH